jgi:hypothetical protein
MPDSTEPSIGHAAREACQRAFHLFVLAVLLTMGAAPAWAQQPGPQPIEAPGDTTEFLPRYDFQLGGNFLSGSDPRFRSDAHFGGATDLLDYAYAVKGRVSIVADYEAVLGTEHQPFDPNQSLYILEGSASAWAGQNELAVTFHHVSRHLGDRAKAYAIAWNILGGRILRAADLGNGTHVAVRAGAGRVVQHADVDYRWNADFDATLRHDVNRNMGVYARGTGETFTVDPAKRGRTDALYGGRFEGGVRLEGRAGALELFAGLEHRIDADPRDYLPVTWAIAGFRLVSK